MAINFFRIFHILAHYHCSLSLCHFFRPCHAAEKSIKCTDPDIHYIQALLSLMCTMNRTSRCSLLEIAVVNIAVSIGEMRGRTPIIAQSPTRTYIISYIKCQHAVAELDGQGSKGLPIQSCIIETYTVKRKKQCVWHTFYRNGSDSDRILLALYYYCPE